MRVEFYTIARPVKGARPIRTTLCSGLPAHSISHSRRSGSVLTVKVGHHDENAKHNPIAPIRHGGFSNTSRHEWSKLPLNTGEQEAQSVELSSNRSKEHIVGHGGHEIALWGWRWKEVSTYLVTSAFLIIAAVVKILYHHSSLHHHVPESW